MTNTHESNGPDSDASDDIETQTCLNAQSACHHDIRLRKSASSMHRRRFKRFQPEYTQHAHSYASSSSTSSSSSSPHHNLLKLSMAVCLFLVALCIYYWYGHLLTFTSLKANHHSIIAFIEDYPVASPFLFVVFECIVVGLTIPGATVLSISAGLFFRQPFAWFYSWIGCGLGALLCYIGVRFICADCFRSMLAKHSQWMMSFERGLQQNELHYLVYVRYVVIIPFWMVNVAAALFGCSIRNFTVSTFLATIPGALLLSTAGRGLARAFQSLHDEDDITAFSLCKQVVYSRDMVACVMILLLCVSLPVCLKKYGGDSFAILGASTTGNTKYRNNDFVDDGDDDHSYGWFQWFGPFGSQSKHKYL